MKKPLLNSFQRTVINKDNSLLSAQLRLFLSIKRLQKALDKEILDPIINLVSY